MTSDLKIVHLKSNGQRIETWIAMLNGDIVGHIYMEREENKKIKFLDAWVHQDQRRKGIFRELWEAMCKYVSEKLSIPNGPKVKKIAGKLQRDIKEKNPNIDLNDLLETSKKHFNNNISTYKKLL